MSQSYIRVAARVGDAYTRVSNVYAVAFKTDNEDFVPYHDDLPGLKNFVELNQESDAVKAMFDPSTTPFKTQVSVGQSVDMIAFIDKVHTFGSVDTYPVTTDGQLYKVYIYAKNESSFELIQPSSVTVTD